MSVDHGNNQPPSGGDQSLRLSNEIESSCEQDEEHETLLPRDSSTGDTEVTKPPKLLFLIAPALLAGIMVSSFDLAFMATSYVRIASSLGHFKDASWILFTTSICSAVVAPLYSYLLRSFGMRRMMLSANAVLALGLTLCALTVSFWQLLGSRFVLGFGNAGITLLAKIIANEVVGVKQLAIWESFATCVAMAVSMAAGPFGAWLSRRFTWHFVFGVEVGFTLLSLIIVYICFAKIKSYHQYQQSTLLKDGDWEVPRPDMEGWVLLVLAVTVPLVAVALGNNILEWTNPVEILLLISGPVLIGCFVGCETRVATNPIINMKPIFNVKYLQVLFQLMGVIFVLNAIAYTIPPYIQVRANGRSSFEDWALTCVFFGLPVGAISGGYLVKFEPIPVPRMMLLDALLLQLISALFASRAIKPESAQAAPFLAAFGICSGFYQSCLLYETVRDTAKEWWPQALALYYLAETFSGDLGMALMAAITRSTAKSGIRSGLGNSAATEKIIKDAMQDLGSISKFNHTVAPVVQAAFENAMHVSFFLPTTVAAIVVVLAISMNVSSRPSSRG